MVKMPTRVCHNNPIFMLIPGEAINRKICIQPIARIMSADIIMINVGVAYESVLPGIMDARSLNEKKYEIAKNVIVAV